MPNKNKRKSSNERTSFVVIREKNKFIFNKQRIKLHSKTANTFPDKEFCIIDLGDGRMIALNPEIMHNLYLLVQDKKGLYHLTQSYNFQVHQGDSLKVITEARLIENNKTHSDAHEQVVESLNQFLKLYRAVEEQSVSVDLKLVSGIMEENKS
ncbi:MAG: hypothetical protein ABIJ81_01270 [Patescibacteria group bacterium]